VEKDISSINAPWQSPGLSQEGDTPYLPIYSFRKPHRMEKYENMDITKLGIALTNKQKRGFLIVGNVKLFTLEKQVRFSRNV
jgi:hypothetical protein